MTAVTKLNSNAGLQPSADGASRRKQVSDLADASVLLNGALPSSQSPQVLEISADAPSRLARKAAEILAFREQRKALFPSKMFGEPAWDILLDLYCHETAGKSISVSSACVAGGAAYATGLRWLRYLVEAGMVRREPDSRDLRYEWVRLQPQARHQIETFLKSL